MQLIRVVDESRTKNQKALEELRDLLSVDSLKQGHADAADKEADAKRDSGERAGGKLSLLHASLTPFARSAFRRFVRALITPEYEPRFSVANATYFCVAFMRNSQVKVERGARVPSLSRCRSTRLQTHCSRAPP